MTGEEVDAIRDLYCVASRDIAERHRGDWRWRLSVYAPAVDVERWHAALEEIQRAMETVDEEEGQAHRHLRWIPGVLPRTLWKIRHARRNRKLRIDYDATMERLRYDVLTAYRNYREQAGDLTRLVTAAREDEDRRLRALQERTEREDREREVQERTKRAAVMADAPGRPVWGCRVRPRKRTEDQYFEIFLQAIDDVGDTRGGSVRTGLTPEQVQAALAEERSRDMYIAVMWSHNTRRALEEWHDSGSAEEAWRELTGVLVDTLPRITEQRRSQKRFYGPSSNYSSPGGFGTH
ncbi:hypothetical protein [Streptomyces cupreus]|uniref:Uncharacterized protein n=1 Tax=Streptomyces cupreus TaxID=2759956 RepID=A0A7X1JC74_9ACTN|nr:hypothetical protein [Streptomyces cupreus]MBC2908071.1 hypothetical protein [Streptomyces cupreus]